jgi:hypothetical protein
MKKFFGAYRVEQDPFRRRVLLRGLTGFRRADLVAPIMNMALADSHVRNNERGRFIWSQSGDYRTRKRAWEWLTKHFAELKHKLPRHSARYLVYFPSARCSEGGKADLNHFFVPLSKGSDAIEGIVRHLGAANDTMDQCIARKAHHRTQLKYWLTPR